MVCCAPNLPRLLVPVCSCTVDSWYLVLLLLLQPYKHENGIRCHVVLQVIMFVKQHPQLSLDWLACLNRVRIERMLVLLPCLVSTMPAMLLLAHHINAVLKG